MSIRELRALLEAGGGNEGSRCIRRARRRMTELEQDGPASWRKRVEELETQLLAATTALAEKDRDLRKAQQGIHGAQEELEQQRQQVGQLQNELSTQQLKFEVEKHRETDTVRRECQQQLLYERQQHERESERADVWIRDIRGRFELEKQQLLERMQALERKPCGTDERTYSAREQPQLQAQEPDPLRST